MNNNGIYIMIIEDYPKLILVMQDFLHSILPKYNLIWYRSLCEAISDFTNFPFDAILLNHPLPDSQALTSLIRIKKKFPQIPVIVTSEVDDKRLRTVLLLGGAAGFLVFNDKEDPYYFCERIFKSILLNQKDSSGSTIIMSPKI